MIDIGSSGTWPPWATRLLISPCISAQSCLISAICSARVVANGRLAIDNVIETSPRWPKAMNRTY